MPHPDHIADLLTPSLPGAACRDHHELFDATIEFATPEVTHAREQALALCASCPCLARCRDWYTGLEPGLKKADAAFISQPVPTPPANAPSAGLLNIVGSVAGEEVSGSLDALVDLIAQLQANGSNPSHIITDPLGWSELRKLKFGTGSNQSLLGAGTTDATPMLLSLPVVVNREVPPYSCVVLDRTAVVSAVSPVSVATDPSVFFVSDSIALRATWRMGFNVVRPDRIGQFTTAAPGS